MMMRMLEAGGIQVLSDHLRKPDEDNPLGYYEFEKAKKTKEDSSWLDEAEGKVVKMVSMLLYDLPLSRQFRVIFMERKMVEILASQKKMLERKGVNRGEDDKVLSRLFQNHLNEIKSWLRENGNFEVLYINYNGLLSTPLPHVEMIKNFISKPLDIGEMISVIDKSLYRQREIS